MKIKKIISLLLTAAIIMAVSAVPVFAATYSSTPEQIVCTPHGDMKTQVGLNWVTAKNNSAAIVQAAPKPAGDFAAAKQYTGEAGDIDNWRWHKVVVDGLNPGTTYQYRVGDGTVWSETREFTTAPETLPEGGFTFLDVNDPQASNATGYAAWGTALSRAVNKFPDFRFITHGGDHVNNGDNEDQWQMFFSSSQSVFGKTIFAGTTGNHDAMNGNRYSYRFNYKMPTTAPVNQGMYYSFDYGNTHIIDINAQAYNDTLQTEWIKYDLVKNAKRWNIVMIHNPLYTNGDHYAEVNVRNKYNAILNDQIGVDVIFAGHDHIYNRTYPILNNAPLSDTLMENNMFVNPAGTVNYVNNACGTKFYNLNTNADTKWFAPINGKAAYQPYKATFSGVTVTDTELINEVYTTDGTSETLLEKSGIKKTLPDMNPPQKVRRSFSGNIMTLSWEAPEEQEGQSVQRYVIYDENNAFTTQNKTYFVEADATKQISVAMKEDVYNKTNFVVKAIGQHSVSEAGTAGEEVQTTPVKLSAAAGEGKAALSWNAPTGATAVDVRLSEDNGKTWSSISAAASGIRLGSAVSADSTTVDVLGLTGGKTYWFKLVVTGGANAGDSTVASAVPTASETEINPGTSLWVKGIKTGTGASYTDINNGISRNSYVVIQNNLSVSVNVICVIGLFDANGRLTGVRLLQPTAVNGGAEGEIPVGEEIQTAGAQYLKAFPYINTLDPIVPGSLPYVLNRK